MYSYFLKILLIRLNISVGINETNTFVSVFEYEQITLITHCLTEFYFVWFGVCIIRQYVKVV